ncbi:MAG: dihydroorotate dehydrogenase electron transfer subunit, partial [Candidatus Dormibacteria bacterium]
VTRLERFGGIYELTVRLPLLASRANPGQFAQIRCGSGVEPLLRRPFSVAWSGGDECAFVFEVVGSGTRLLSALHPGDQLDVLGPLGTSFSIDAECARAVMVSGGVGCAPFPFLVARLADRVANITVLSGAATASRLYPAERFARNADVRVLQATDDGSAGRAGFVTELLDDAVDAGTTVYACGPNRMLAAVWERVRSGAPRIAEASLEAPMGCGYGTCLGCALPLRSTNDEMRWALCCSDGPVMPMRDVAWEVVHEMPTADVA